VAAQDVFALAKQGDPDAIAMLINQSTRKLCVSATVRSAGSCLKVILVSAKVPDSSTCIPLIYYGMQQLHIPSITTVEVEGRKIGRNSPAWSRCLTLDAPLPEKKKVKGLLFATFKKHRFVWFFLWPVGFVMGAGWDFVVQSRLEDAPIAQETTTPSPTATTVSSPALPTPTVTPTPPPTSPSQLQL